MGELVFPTKRRVGRYAPAPGRHVKPNIQYSCEWPCASRMWHNTVKRLRGRSGSGPARLLPKRDGTPPMACPAWRSLTFGIPNMPMRRPPKGGKSSAGLERASNRIWTPPPSRHVSHKHLALQLIGFTEPVSWGFPKPFEDKGARKGMTLKGVPYCVLGGEPNRTLLKLRSDLPVRPFAKLNLAIAEL
jgi:hypothetical protein